MQLATGQNTNQVKLPLSFLILTWISTKLPQTTTPVKTQNHGDECILKRNVQRSHSYGISMSQSVGQNLQWPSYAYKMWAECLLSVSFASKVSYANICNSLSCELILVNIFFSDEKWNTDYVFLGLFIYLARWTILIIL